MSVKKAENKKITPQKAEVKTRKAVKKSVSSKPKITVKKVKKEVKIKPKKEVSPVKKEIKPKIRKTVKKVGTEKKVVAPVEKKTGEKFLPKGREIIWATGKRKTAIAQVQFFPQGQGKILINKRTVQEYFPIFDLGVKVLSPLKILAKEKDFDFTVIVKGGGVHSQADAVSLGIARALIFFNPEWRKEFKSIGLLKRDPRKKERKKPGLKRARRAPQWKKR